MRREQTLVTLVETRKGACESESAVHTGHEVIVVFMDWSGTFVDSGVGRGERFTREDCI